EGHQRGPAGRRAARGDSAASRQAGEERGGDPQSPRRGQRSGEPHPGGDPARRDRRHLLGRRVRPAMIKFVAAGLWLCAVTIGAVSFWFQMWPASSNQEPPAPLLGGLDYVGTPVISVPVLTDKGIVGYILARLVFTGEPEKLRKLSVPAETLFSDQLYTYLF